MEHKWSELAEKNGRRHVRCGVCRMICALPGTIDEADIARITGNLDTCPGPFLMPPYESEAWRLRMAKWIATGVPRRSAEEVARIYGDHCETCGHRTIASVCEKCDCRVLPSGPPETNLVALATAKCPIGLWE